MAKDSGSIVHELKQVKFFSLAAILLLLVLLIAFFAQLPVGQYVTPIDTGGGGTTGGGTELLAPDLAVDTVSVPQLCPDVECPPGQACPEPLPCPPPYPLNKPIYHNINFDNYGTKDVSGFMVVSLYNNIDHGFTTDTATLPPTTDYSHSYLSSYLYPNLAGKTFVQSIIIPKQFYFSDLDNLDNTDSNWENNIATRIIDVEGTPSVPFLPDLSIEAWNYPYPDAWNSVVIDKNEAVWFIFAVYNYPNGGYADGFSYTLNFGDGTQIMSSGFINVTLYSKCTTYPCSVNQDPYYILATHKYSREGTFRATFSVSTEGEMNWQNNNVIVTVPVGLKAKSLVKTPQKALPLLGA